MANLNNIVLRSSVKCTFLTFQLSKTMTFHMFFKNISFKNVQDLQ